jgi:hypothetical protein
MGPGAMHKNLIPCLPHSASLSAKQKLQVAANDLVNASTPFEMRVTLSSLPAFAAADGATNAEPEVA